MSTHITTTTVDHFVNSKFYDILVFTKITIWVYSCSSGAQTQICFNEPIISILFEKRFFIVC